jgi:maleate isomerase
MNARVKRLGMLVPSSNTVLEPATAALLPADGSVTAHVARLRVVRIADDADSDAQFALDRVLAAAEMLADAEVDLILWNGTAASWLGFERDAELVAAIERHTAIRATTALLALNAELARRGARRIGLVTPYVAAIEARITAHYAAAGITVVTAIRADLTENTAYARIPPDVVCAMVRQAAREPVDAVLIVCTNVAGAALAPDLERELGVPVLDSVRVAIEGSLNLLSDAGGAA